MKHTPPTEPQSRYDNHVGDTYTGLPRASGPLGVRVTTAKVQDPSERNPEAKNQRIAVSVNRNVDILETERSHNRISEAAYRTGRTIQKVFERTNGLRTTFRAEPSPSRDAAMANANAIDAGLDGAREATRMTERMQYAVGWHGAIMIRAVISEGMTYRDIAAAEGNAGGRGTSAVASLFRWLLERVADHFARGGR